jgi:hypothetical protein
MDSELGDDEVVVLHELDWQIGGRRSMRGSTIDVFGRYIANGVVAYGSCWCVCAEIWKHEWSSAAHRS